MHTVFALLCFIVVIHWLIFPYPSGLLHWHCGNLTIAPVPPKQHWWIWINTSCEFIMNDCITTTKQSTTKPCAYFLGYTVTFQSLETFWGQLAKLRQNTCMRDVTPPQPPDPPQTIMAKRKVGGIYHRLSCDTGQVWVCMKDSDIWLAVINKFCLLLMWFANGFHP